MFQGLCLEVKAVGKMSMWLVIKMCCVLSTSGNNERRVNVVSDLDHGKYKIPRKAMQ